MLIIHDNDWNALVLFYPDIDGVILMEHQPMGREDWVKDVCGIQDFDKLRALWSMSIVEDSLEEFTDPLFI